MGIEDIVSITLTEPPPSEATIGEKQQIKGTVKLAAIGAPPFVYAEIQKKDWYKPDILEKTWHERGFPMPISGEFTIDWVPDKKAHYEVTVVATPAPLSLPVVGVFPILGKSDTYKVEVGEAPPEEERVRTFRIVSYSKNAGPPVPPPDILELDIGDRCRVNVAFDHQGPSISGKFHAAIWKWEWYDPHSEKLDAEKEFTTPSTGKDEWQSFEDHIDIPITSGIKSGDYGLYVKIMSVTGDDVFTEYLENVIRIVGVPIEDFSLERPTISPPSPVEPDTEIVISCPVTFHDLVTKTINAKCIIYEGSFFPGHGTKLAEYFSQATSIAPGETKVFEFPHTTVAGTIDRRDVEVEVYIAGARVKQSEWDDVYYVKAPEMETLEVKIDPVGAGYVTVSPAPAGGVEHNWEFLHGTTVTVTAHPNPGYQFKSWSGEMKDTTDIMAPVYPMTEHRLITAHFKIEVAVLTIVDIKINGGA